MSRVEQRPEPITIMSKQPAVVTQLRHAPGVKRANLFRIETEKFEIEKGHNPRNYELPENRAHLDRLKLTIAKYGVETPVKVRFSGEKIIIVDGECRWRSCMEILAEDPNNEFVKTIPATQEDGNEIERLRLAFTSNDGKPLSEWELGNGYKRFIKMGKDVKWIAEELGVTEKNVNTCIELSNAPMAVQEMLSNLSVTPAAAVHAVRVHGDNASFVLKQKVEEAKQRTAEKPAAKKKGKTPAAPKPVGREKKSNGVHVPFKTLEIIQAALAGVLREQGTLEDSILEQCETSSKLVEKLLVKEGK